MGTSKKSHLYKYLARYAYLGVFFFIFLAVCIFNYLWTGLGENPKTSLLPEVTKDYEEFKDHATLIIALMAAVGSILSSLLIISFYGAWKDQHNQSILTDEARKILLIFINVSKSSEQITSIFNNVDIINYLSVNQVGNSDHFKNFITNLDLGLSNLKYFLELTQNDDYILYRELLVLLDKYQDFFKSHSEKNMNTNLEENEKKIRLEIDEKNIQLRHFLKDYILLS